MVEPTDRADDEATGEAVAPVEEEPEEPPSAEALEQIRADLGQLLELMGFPSEVRVVFEDNTVHCTITGAHEEQIVGPEGRTLDSLQYLLRKMVAACVPDRIMLYRAISKTPKLYQVPVDLILLTPEEFDKETSIRMSFIRNGVRIPVQA